MSEIIPFPRNSARPETPQIPERVAETPAKCPRCHGDGWFRRNVPWGHPDFGKALRCECQDQVVNARYAVRTYTWLNKWLGERDKQTAKLESMTFLSFRDRANGPSVTEACTRARDYALQMVGSMQAVGMHNVVMVSSIYGVGKTHLACAILNDARNAGVGCLFVSGNDLFNAIYTSDFDASIMQAAIKTPLLCLDDLDKMQAKEDGSFQKTTLFTLFEQRELAGLPTIITANETEDWKRWVHGAVLSRLFGNAEMIVIAGKDYRLFGKHLNERKLN